MRKIGYWVDLRGISFSDSDSTTTWIQAFPLGQYKHPLYGKLDVTPELVSRLAENVKLKVRGQELDIDYDHKARDGRAAGWVKDAEARSDGLWILVEWTKEASEAIKNKEYRYFSPEYVDKWQHPKTGVVHKSVLFGGGLTNRPFLKDILPINLSELDEGGQVNEFLEKLRKKLGLPEDATEEQILGSIELVDKDEEEEEEEDELEIEEEDDDEVEELEAIAASEELIKLAEQSPVVKQLLEQGKQQQKRIAVLEASNKLSEANRVVDAWESKGKFALPAKVKDKARKLLMESSTEFQSFMEDILETGLVDLSEQGASRTKEESGTATKQFSEEVKALMDGEDKLSYADAVTRVAEGNPGLFEDYRREAMQPQEV